MKNVARRKALWIEVGVVLLWLVVPLIVSQVVKYSGSSPRPGSIDVYQFVQVLTYSGRIAGLCFIIWQSGDGFSSFGIIKDRFWRVLGLSLLLLGLGMAVTLVMTLPTLSNSRRLRSPAIVLLGGLAQSL